MGTSEHLRYWNKKENLASGINVLTLLRLLTYIPVKRCC